MKALKLQGGEKKKRKRVGQRVVELCNEGVKAGCFIKENKELKSKVNIIFETV